MGGHRVCFNKQAHSPRQPLYQDRCTKEDPSRLSIPKTNTFLRSMPIMNPSRVGFVEFTQIFTRADPQLRVARRRRCIASESDETLWNLRTVRNRSISGTQ